MLCMPLQMSPFPLAQNNPIPGVQEGCLYPRSKSGANCICVDLQLLNENVLWGNLPTCYSNNVCSCLLATRVLVSLLATCVLVSLLTTCVLVSLLATCVLVSLLLRVSLLVCSLHVSWSVRLLQVSWLVCSLYESACYMCPH